MVSPNLRMDAPPNLRQQIMDLTTAMKDVEKTWVLDLPELLNSYIERLTGGGIDGEEYAEALDFIEAALLVEYTAQLYSKKVDHFIRNVWDLLEKLRNNLSGGDADEPRRTVYKRRSTARQSLDIEEMCFSAISTNGKLVDGENNASRSSIKFFPPKSKYTASSVDGSGRTHVLFDSRGDSMPNSYEFRCNWRTTSDARMSGGYCVEEENGNLTADSDRTDDECLEDTVGVLSSSVQDEESNTLLGCTTQSGVVDDSDTLTVDDSHQEGHSTLLAATTSSTVNSQNTTVVSFSLNDADTGIDSSDFKESEVLLSSSNNEIDSGMVSSLPNDLNVTEPSSPFKEANVIAHSTPFKDGTSSHCRRFSDNSFDSSGGYESDESEETYRKIEDILRARISGNDDEAVVSFKDLWTPINVSPDIADRILRRRSQAHGTSCQCGEETHSRYPSSKVEYHSTNETQKHSFVEQQDPNIAEEQKTCAAKHQECNVHEHQEFDASKYQEHNSGALKEANEAEHQESNSAEHQEHNSEDQGENVTKHQHINGVEDQESDIAEHQEPHTTENEELNCITEETGSGENQKLYASENMAVNTINNSTSDHCVTVKLSATVDCLLRLLLRKQTQSRIRQPEADFVTDAVEEHNRRCEMSDNPSIIDNARKEKEDNNKISAAVESTGFRPYDIARSMENYRCTFQLTIEKKGIAKTNPRCVVQARRDNNKNAKLKPSNNDSVPIPSTTSAESDSALFTDVNCSPTGVVNNADGNLIPALVASSDDIADSGYKSGREDININGETDLDTHSEKQCFEVTTPYSESEENIQPYSDEGDEDIYQDEDNLAETLTSQVSADEMHQEQEFTEDIHSESSEHFNREPSVTSELFYDDSEYFTAETQDTQHDDDLQYKRDMDERVLQWQTYVEPFLLRSEERSNFSINEYSEKIIKYLSSKNENVSFHHFMEGRKGCDVSRYLMSSLLLANNGRVKISRPSNEDLTADDFELTALNGGNRVVNNQEDEFQGSSHMVSKKRVYDMSSVSHESSGKKQKQSSPIVNGQLDASSMSQGKYKQSSQKSDLHNGQNKRPQDTSIAYNTPPKKVCVNGVKNSYDTASLNVKHTQLASSNRQHESDNERFKTSDSEREPDDDSLREAVPYRNPRRILFPATNHEHSASSSHGTGSRGREGSPQPGPSWR